MCLGAFRHRVSFPVMQTMFSQHVCQALTSLSPLELSAGPLVSAPLLKDQVSCIMAPHPIAYTLYYLIQPLLSGVLALALALGNTPLHPEVKIICQPAAVGRLSWFCSFLTSK